MFAKNRLLFVFAPETPPLFISRVIAMQRTALIEQNSEDEIVVAKKDEDLKEKRLQERKEMRQKNKKEKV